MQGPFIEDCLYLTSTFDKVDYNLMQKRNVQIEYHIEAEDHILVTVGDKEPRRIDTEDVTTFVSWRRYFLCPCCGERVYKLYLLPNGKEFKCRKCHKLKYTLTSINKKSRHGKMLYAMNRTNKLVKMRENMGTILYKGKYTKRFRGFLKQCERAGLMHVVKDAMGLMGALNEFETAQILDKA